MFVFLDAVLLSFPNKEWAKESLVHKQMMTYISLAADRCGGRKERMERKRQEAEVDNQ